MNPPALTPLIAEQRPDRSTARPGTLYMIPCPIAPGDPFDTLPAANGAIVRSLDYFIVEELRTARRFLSRLGMPRPIDELELALCNEHTRPEELEALVAPIAAGRSAGVISEAGMPGVADPGAAVAALCHRRGIRVRPLTGPSSLLLALAASGLNGQSFAFAGYLPVKPAERQRAIRRLEQRAAAERQSQLFIEAPYRNARLFDDLIAVLRPATLLTLAVDLTGPDELILTAPVSEWRSRPRPVIDKHPTVFILL